MVLQRMMALILKIFIQIFERFTYFICSMVHNTVVKRIDLRQCEVNWGLNSKSCIGECPAHKYCGKRSRDNVRIHGTRFNLTVCSCKLPGETQNSFMESVLRLCVWFCQFCKRACLPKAPVFSFRACALTYNYILIRVDICWKLLILMFLEMVNIWSMQTT